jgi:pyruvate kinase
MTRPSPHAASKKDGTMPSTKIVCTIGPSSRSEAVLERLIRAGMNVARLNFSHGTQAEHAEAITRIRALAAKLGQPVAILQDLQGPKIRTGVLRDHQSVLLVEGAPCTLTTEPLAGDASRVSTTYQQLPQDVRPGAHIFLADGLLELEVIDANDTEVHCRVVHGGLLGEHKGINLPGVAVSAPALTEKDIDDLRFGVAQDVDFVGISFVRQASDIKTARAIIADATALPGFKASGAKRAGATSGPPKPPSIIAKLEKPEAIRHLDAILDAADG